MSTNIKIFGTLISVSFLLIVGLVIRYTGAADVATTAEITNEPPTVDTIRFSTTAYGADDLTSSGILPNVGTDRTIHINGVMSDANGENDIASSTINLVFHKTTSTNICLADNNDCYVINSCDTNYTDGDDTQIAYNCEVPIQYFIDATDAASIYAEDTWTAYVAVEDLATAQGTLTATIEVNSLLALNLPDAIDYGTRTLGEVSSSTTNVETTITQRGNTKADVQVSGGNMACTALGSLATSTQAWALTSVGHTASTILTDTLVATERNIDLRTDESNELDVNLYWNIAIPASGVKGTCTGSNTIAVIAQPAGPLMVQYDGGPYDATGENRNNGGYYRTVTIGTQTWFKDNLNAGVMLASGTTEPADNGTIEKWCYNNSTTNCDNEGGLYNWNETMGYVTTEGAQGICPTGWHIPTDNEYKTLEIFLGMTQVEADATGWRGTDQGTPLKVGGSSGFDGVLAGNRNSSGAFGNQGSSANLWSSSISGSDAWIRNLLSVFETVYRNTIDQDFGFAIRCLKD